MKTMSLKDGLLHIETPLGVINIRVGLTDMHGRRVDSVTVIPDETIGDRKIIRRGYYNTRMIELKGARSEGMSPTEELLEACRMMLRLIEGEGLEEKFDGETTILRDAIAKAEGGGVPADVLPHIVGDQPEGETP